MIFSTRNIKQVEEFWLKNFNMTTKMMVNIPDCDEFKNEFRDFMEDQFERSFYNESFGGEDRFIDSVTLEDRIESLLTIIECLGGPKPNNSFASGFDEMLGLQHKAMQPELQELMKILKKHQDIPLKTIIFSVYMNDFTIDLPA